MLVLMETYKSSLLLAARGLICNSGWAADAVQRSITSLRRGERGCEGAKVVIRRKNVPIAADSPQLHITIYSLSCLIIIISVPSICDSPFIFPHLSLFLCLCPSPSSVLSPILFIFPSVLFLPSLVSPILSTPSPPRMLWPSVIDEAGFR